MKCIFCMFACILFWYKMNCMYLLHVFSIFMNILMIFCTMNFIYKYNELKLKIKYICCTVIDGL